MSEKQITVKNYRDKYQMLHVFKREPCENPILLRAIEYFVTGYEDQLFHACQAHMHGGDFKQTPWAIHDPISHDNMTTIFVLSDFVDMDAYKHPRDFIYVWGVQGKILGHLLSPLFFIASVYSCLRTDKIRPNIWERPRLWWLKWRGQIKVGDWIDTRNRRRKYFSWVGMPDEPYGIYYEVMHHTDGKILTWLRMQRKGFPVTKAVCFWILRLRYGKKFLHELLKIYLDDSEHPLIVATRSHVP